MQPHRLGPKSRKGRGSDCRFVGSHSFPSPISTMRPDRPAQLLIDAVDPAAQWNLAEKEISE